MKPPSPTPKRVSLCGWSSDSPGALKEAEGRQVVGRFEEVSSGGSFVQDAEAVELHAAAGVVQMDQSVRRTHGL